jgi:hypothetical protein
MTRSAAVGRRIGGRRIGYTDAERANSQMARNVLMATMLAMQGSFYWLACITSYQSGSIAC